MKQFEGKGVMKLRGEVRGVGFARGGVARAGVVAGMCLVLLGCLGVPEGVEPVQGFDAQRYFGRWYEVARLNHRFERDLADVTAHYSRREDGTVRVINRGYDTKDEEWTDIEGTARFVGDEDVAHLKVSFFGPFYASYVVFELDQKRYDYAFVAGFNKDYLWLLSRSPEVSDQVRGEFIERAKTLGFATDELIWVEHSRQQDPPQ